MSTLPPHTSLDVATSVPPARRRWRLWVALGAAVLVSVAAVSTVLLQPPRVPVLVVRAQVATRLLAITGRVEADRTVRVSSQVIGRLVLLTKHEGDRVQRGEVIARIANGSARAATDEQRGALAAKEAELAQARRDLVRAEHLSAAGAGTSAQLEAARLAVDGGKGDRARLVAALAVARTDLGNYVLIAPFDGVVLQRPIDTGQLVVSSTIIYEIAADDALRVTAEVDERYVRLLHPGLGAQVLPIGAAEALPVTIVFVSRFVDDKTGASTVRFAFETPQPGLPIGLSVDINVVVETLSNALVVPRSAIDSSGRKSFVYVIGADARVAVRPIDAPDWPSAALIVRGGLVDGDRVVLDMARAHVGRRVRAEPTDDAL